MGREKNALCAVQTVGSSFIWSKEVAVIKTQQQQQHQQPKKPQIGNPHLKKNVKPPYLKILAHTF